MGKFCGTLGHVATCFCFYSKARVEDTTEENNEVSPEPQLSVGIAPTTGSSPLPYEPLSPVLMTSQNPSSNSIHHRMETNNNNGNDICSDPAVVEWTSGARKESVTINWKVQNFPALCELKELLRSEPCVFTVGNTVNASTRWCFNLQKMKNENNIGLFLKRLKPLSFNDITQPTLVGVNLLDESPTDGNNQNNTENMQNNEILAAALNLVNGRNIPVPPEMEAQSGSTKEETDPVYVYYECIVKRSGYGDVWLHKRTCIPNFEIGQRLGFRKLFTLDEMNEADQQQTGATTAKPVPLLGPDNSLNLEIKFTIHLKTDGRTRSELDLLKMLSLERSERYHCQLLRDQFTSMLKTGNNSDLILIIEADDRTFSVHKAILSARSPVFAAMVQSGMKESHSGIVRIKDVSSKAMENVLSYIYSGLPHVELKWSDLREVQELIYAADKYSLHGLRDLCDKMMFTGCGNENATELLYLAQQHGLNNAAKEISLYIKRNVNEIFDEKAQN